MKDNADYSKFTDFELSLLITKRDVAQYAVERYDEILATVGRAKGLADVGLEKKQAAVNEATFNLKYEEQTGPKLGLYAIAHEQVNIPEKWRTAYNILKNADSTISNRYHGEGYVYGFWIFNGKIYRQKLNG